MPAAGSLKLRALTKRAELIGVDEALLDNAVDSAEVIELIVAKEQANAAEASAKLEVRTYHTFLAVPSVRGNYASLRQCPTFTNAVIATMGEVQALTQLFGRCRHCGLSSVE